MALPKLYIAIVFAAAAVVSGCSFSGDSSQNAAPASTKDIGRILTPGGLRNAVGDTAPAITTQPANLTVREGNSATFSVVATGTPAPTFQWRKDAVVITGATSATYTIASADLADQGAYSVVATNTVGSVTSNNATLTVQTLPAITQQPTSQTANVGANVTFSVTATGNPAPTYQWQKNAANISGATSATLTLTNIQLAAAGNYRVVVNNVVGSVNSVAATLTVQSPPAITTQPANLTVREGNSATFSVVATGTPAPTFQWRKDAVVITDATSATYTIPSADLPDQGAYSVVVTNTVGSITSNNAILSVQTLPTITQQPTSQTANVGTNVTFSVTAAGNPAPTYQWQKNGANINGATSASLVLNNVQTTAGAGYRVIVTNVVGSVTSTTATLTVQSGPTITTQPTNLTVREGNSATFSVVATGTPAPTFQWRKDAAVITGATSATYTTPSADLADEGVYSVVVTNTIGSVTSNNATLTVQTLPAITQQPTSQTANVGTNVTFSVTATGNPAPTYQWQKNGTNISGATSATLSLMNVQLSAGGDYRAVVTNVVGSVNSNVATLTVQSAPAITTQPANLTVRDGSSATFSVVANGTPAPAYQWRKDAADITGATSATYTIAAADLGDQGTYSVVVTNTIGSVTSNNAALTVQTLPVITQQPTSQTANVGTNVTFSVTATGNPTPTYQWQKNAANISGATNATLTLTSIQLSAAGDYRVVVSNIVGSVNSSAATLTVQSPPAITTQPANLTVREGNSATFSVVATGTPAPAFQWRKDAVVITGATSATYTIASADLADQGAYSVVATNTIGSVTSNNATLTVQTLPVITQQPTAQTANVGTNVTFSVTATGNPAPTYQWQKNAANISGATSANLSLNNVQLAAAGDYRVVVTNVVGNVTSNIAKLTVQSPPAITTQPMNLTVRENNAANFSVIATGTPAPTYQWRKDGTNITGATSATYAIASADLGDEGLYSVVVTNILSSVTSNDARLTVQTAPTITTQPLSQTVRAGLDATFTVVATGNPAPTYQWQFNNANISGATNSTLTLTAVQLNQAGSYRVVVTNIVSSLTSNAAVLTVTVPPSIATQPTNVTVKENDPATFTVVATPGIPAATTYQWQKNGTNINGATAATFTIATAKRTDRGNYRVVVSNTTGSVTSNEAVLDVQYAPTITTQPASFTSEPNVNGSFVVVVDANPAATYQWKNKNPLTSVVANVTGATDATLSFNPVLYRHRGEYSVVITNTLGTIESNKVQLILPPASRGPASVNTLNFMNLKIDRTGGFE